MKDLLTALAIAGTLSPAAATQAVPDFSGQWTVVAAPAASTGAPPRGDMGSGFGSPITITQNAQQIVVEQTLFSRYDLQPPVRQVYALDGSESRNAVMIGHAAQVRTSRATWDGQSLRITTTYPAIDPSSGKTFTTEASYQLTLSSPTTLVIEAVRAGALGGGATSTRTTYQKG